MINSILVKNLFLSSSSLNILKTEPDKKKRNKIVGNLVGIGLLYLILMAFCVFTAIGYGYMNLTAQIPVLCCLTISALEFLFTIFKTNGYLFAFKDYDMLMSLPFSVKDVVSSKFLYMYIQNLPWTISISLAFEIGYGIFAKPAFYIYIIWFVLSLLIPMIPMILASVIGVLIAAAGSKSKHKTFVQIFLTIVFVIFAISLRFIIESMFKNDKVEQTLTQLSEITTSIKNVYFPIKLFENSVVNCNILSIFLFILTNAIVFEVVFSIISRFYRQINSKLMSSSASKKFKMSHQKNHSIVTSIAIKEFRHFVSSVNYFVNVGLGQIIVIILSIAVLFVDFDKILYGITNGSPVTKQILLPAVPMVVYWLISMMVSTSVSVSLEGKNYWIIQSLPITTKDFYKGKMLFNLWITVPFSVLGNIALGFACGGTFLEVCLCVITGIIQCLFCTCWGMICGLKFVKFDWENEMEIIKQGTGTVVYLLPNMFISMGLVVLSVFLGIKFGTFLVILFTALIYLLLSLITYLIVMKKKSN